MPKYTKSLLVVYLVVALSLGSLPAQALTVPDMPAGAPRWNTIYNSAKSAIVATINDMGTVMANYINTVDSLTLLPATPTYIDDQTLRLPGDYTALLTPGKRLVADCGADGLRPLTVTGCTFAAGTSTVSVGNAAASNSWYGTPWRYTNLNNFPVGGANPNDIIDFRIRAQQTGPVNAVQVYLMLAVGGAYTAGTGGTVRCAIQADDGTGHPSGVDLAYFQHAANANQSTHTADAIFGTLAGAGASFISLPFNSPATLQAGQLYHLVFSNPDSAPTTNFYALDTISTNYNGNLQPAYPTADLAVLQHCLGDSTWYGNPDPVSAPIYTLHYASGQVQGQPYMQMDQTIAVYGSNYKARQKFTPTANQVLSRVNVLASKTGTPPDLTCTLQTAAGATITAVTLPASSFVTDPTNPLWGSAPLPALQTLVAGSTYFLVLSAPAGDSSNYYTVMGLQDGAKAYTLGGDSFADGALAGNPCSSTTDGGSSWIVANNADNLPVYFNLASHTLTGNLAALSYYATRNGVNTYGSGDVVAGDYGPPSWASLQSALGVATATGHELLLTPGNWPVSADLAISCAVRLVPGAVLTRTSGSHLTINASFECGLGQAFSDNSANHDWVVFGADAVKEIYSEWWGAVGDATSGTVGTLSTAALQAAITAAAGRPLLLPGAGYRIDATLVANGPQNIRGANNTAIFPDPAGSYAVDSRVGSVVLLLDYDATAPYNLPRHSNTGWLLGKISNLLINNNSGAYTSLKGIVAANSYEFADINGSNLKRLIEYVGEVDSAKIHRCYSLSCHPTEYQFKMEFGANVDIDQISAYSTEAPFSVKTLYLQSVYGGVAQNIINGIRLDNCSSGLKVNGVFIESGQLLINDSSARIDGGSITVLNPAYPPVVITMTTATDNSNLVTLKNFLWRRGLKTYSGAPYYVAPDILMDPRAVLVTENCFRTGNAEGGWGMDMSTTLSLGKQFLSGIRIFKADGTTEMADWADNAAQLSLRGRIERNYQITPDYVVKGSHIPYTLGASAGFDAAVPWGGMPATYFYKKALILDPTRWIGFICADAEEAVAITAAAPYWSNPVPAGYPATAILRLFRGTVSGNYNYYFDVPMVNCARIWDQGVYVNTHPSHAGYGGGGLPTLYPCDYLKKQGANVTVGAPGCPTPTTGTWQVGDRIVNTTPTIGQPKALVCTDAAYAGTWVSEGNL